MAYKMDSGIYKITCLPTCREYIGVTRCFAERKYNHFRSLKRGNHRNDFLQRAYNKYGKDNFIFEVIERVEGYEDCLKREIYWIEKLNTYGNGFNLTVGGEGWIPNQATRDKRSKSLSGKNNPMYGMVGSLNGNAKMTEYKARKIKKMIAMGFRNRDITEFMNITNNQCSKIKNGITWKHITLDEGAQTISKESRTDFITVPSANHPDRVKI